MYYTNELSFLKDVFKKTNLSVYEINGQEFANSFVNLIIDDFFNNDTYLKDVIKKTKPRTLYKIIDIYDRCYRLLVLPETPTHTVLCVGPFLSSPISEDKLLYICENNNISPQKQRFLNEYYISLPILPAESHLLTMLNTFCERIWDNPSFSVEEIEQKYSLVDFPISKTMQDNNSDILVNIKALERRYAYENELIRAVSLGIPNSEARFSNVFTNEFFEKRVADPLKNAKNYCIIMNTLLRKSAEKGGVHPFHLDQISSDFAGKIESLSNLLEIPPLMNNMFTSYCKLVRKNSLKKYSLVVQKTILIIDSDLSAELSTSCLASKLNVSLGYLSNVFKKETGKTLSEYIRQKRINYAKHLMNTTNLQIQTIALHCGIMDLQYFSKIFKRQTGKTPTEYKQLIKNK